MSDIDDLHERLFGFRPAKMGEAYERLAAIVLARLGWTDVRHDTTEGADGRLAEHQLDVTARHPSGEIRRLLLECKDWNKTVGKATMDVLVGVRAQVGADAAAVATTQGYTDGARKVAVDEDIAMLILRPTRQSDEGAFVKRVEITLDCFFPSIEDFTVVSRDGRGDAAGKRLDFALDSADRLSHIDGTPAESIQELIERTATPMQVGRFDRSVEFPEGRVIEAVDGTRLQIARVTWTEAVNPTQQTIVSEREGEPCLVLEQLDESGERGSSRLLVDKELWAWEIEDSGSVVSRGDLHPARPAG